MNNIFTWTSQTTIFRAQALHDEPENKGMMYNFGYKDLNPRENLFYFYLSFIWVPYKVPKYLKWGKSNCQSNDSKVLISNLTNLDIY